MTSAAMRPLRGTPATAAAGITAGSAVVALLVLGAAVRLAAYLRRPALWGDEAMLALNVAQRSLAGLTHPLDYAQIATVPFLWGERLAVTLGGVTEYSLRIVPLLAGLALLPLAWGAGRRLLGPLGAVAFVGLLATSIPLLRYSGELKPYSLDALVALGFLWYLLERRGELRQGRGWLRLGLAGAAAIVLSLPAAFVTGAAGAALAWDALDRSLPPARRRALLGRLALAGLAWAALFAVLYAVCYRAVASSEYMRQYWHAAFLVPSTPDLAGRIGRAWEETALGVFALAFTGDGAVVLAVAALGAAAFARRMGRPAALVITGPIVAAFAASALGRYPVSTRTMLFTAPLLGLLVAAGLEEAAAWLAARRPWFRPRWLIGAALVPGIVLVTGLSIRPSGGEDVRTLARVLDRRAAPHDPVYVFHRATPAWTYYTTGWDSPDWNRLRWTAEIASPGGAGFVNAPSRGARPVGEGRELTYTVGRRLHLYGVACGVQAAQWAGFTPTAPDAGWAENEADRMRAVARPVVWIVLADHAHPTAHEGDVLLAAVERAGARVILADSLEYSALYRAEFAAGSTP
ncbi:MAG TPA: glycosyltransferase family 39 protein [Gemmatimonadales bacterium]|nr:glycosyltransferase family 39 protein [Gemmatimonadales bacterium]